MREQTAAPKQQHGTSETDFELRMKLLEAQMERLMLERYGRTTDRERYEDLRARARAVGGELEKTFGFDEKGCVTAAISGSKCATYRRPYWLVREASELTATLAFDLPKQFARLERAIARDEQTYQERIRSLAYSDEIPAVWMMARADFESRLQKLARTAGGGLELKTSRQDGKVYVYYYRYKRLKTATVFNSLLTHAPYHSTGKHRYTFWLPIDYVLLRQLLDRDAEIYAALPEEMRRPGYPARKVADSA